MNNIALCFCVRNCEKYLAGIFSNIALLKTLNVNVFSVFVYDNCSDKSKYMLEEYQKKNMDSVIIRNIINNSNWRTERIAKARNTCLDIVYNELDNITFHIMIDCDDVCVNKWNINVINNYLFNFDNDNWDCISFNRDDYYDIWALMFNDFKHHCLGFNNNTDRVIGIMKNAIKQQLNTCKSNSIEVISAFNGFCIYKTNKFKGFYYDGLYSTIKKLITEEERINTIRKFKEYGLDVTIKDNSIESCEHLFYHLTAFKKGCKIKVSKLKIV